MVAPADQDGDLRWTRRFGVGPIGVVIGSTEPDLIEHLDHLFSAFPEVGEAGGPMITVDVRPTEEGYETQIGDQLPVRHGRAGGRDAGVAARLNRLALDHEPDLVHLHAGVVARDRCGVVLLGPSGSGKSTFTVHLVRSGWTYLTDEMAAVSADPLCLHPYPRPLTLRSASWGLFDRLPAVVEAAAAVPVPPHLLLAPASLCARVARSPVAPALLVSIQWTDGEPSVEPLSVAEALGALVTNTMDLGRAGPAGMEALVELATSVPAIRLRTSDLARSEQLLIEALDDARRRPMTPRHIPPAGHRDPRAHAWLVEGADLGVLYQQDSGVTVVVDRGGLAVWEVMAVTSDVDEIAALLGVPPGGSRGIALFLADLGQHGLLGTGP